MVFAPLSRDAPPSWDVAARKKTNELLNQAVDVVWILEGIIRPFLNMIGFLKLIMRIEALVI